MDGPNYQAARRKRLRDDGRCGECGGPSEGTYRCVPCKKANSFDARRRYRAKKGGQVRAYVRRGPSKCSLCDQTGHNSRGCRVQEV